MWKLIKWVIWYLFIGYDEVKYVEPKEEVKWDVLYEYPKPVTQRRPRPQQAQPNIYLAWVNPEPVKQEVKREDIYAWINSVREVDAIRAKMQGAN